MTIVEDSPPLGRTAAGPPARLEPLLELDRLAVAVRLRRRWCLIGALAGGVFGLAVPHVLGGGPTATATVLVSRGDETGPLKSYADKAAVLQAEGAAVQAGVLPSTGVALCSSGSVAGPAAAALGIAPAAMLADYFCSDAAPDVIRVTVRGKTPTQAKRAAAAVADAFLTAYRAQGHQTADVQYADLLAQRGHLEADLADVTRSLAGSTYPAQIQSLTDLQKSLLTRIDDLTARASDLQTVATTEADGSRIVDPPISVPRPRKLLFPIAGAGLGLGLGAAWAALGVVIRDRPLRRREVATALDEPIALDIRHTRHGLRRRPDVSAAAPVVARLLRAGNSVLVLDSGCPEVARALAAAAAQPPTAADDSIPSTPAAARIVLGSLRPAGLWLTPGPGVRVAVLLVRAGHESAPGLRAATDDLRQAGIGIAAVFLVDPDPYDRTDGFAAEAYGRLFELQQGGVT